MSQNFSCRSIDNGMPAFLNSSSNMSLFSPTSLLVFKSETTSERTLGIILSTISGMGSISFPLKLLGVLAHPVLLIVLPVPSAGLSRLWGFFWAGCIGLSWLPFVSCDSAGIGQQRSICPYQALRFIWVTFWRISWSCCPLHGCEKK